MKTETIQIQLSHNSHPEAAPQTDSGNSTAGNLPLPSTQPASRTPVGSGQAAQAAQSVHSVQPVSPPEPTEPAQHSKPPQYSAAASDNLDAIQQNRFDSIARRQRANSFLRSLRPEQLRQVHAAIQECQNINDAHARITAAPPNGLGLTVSVITLRRLRSLWRACDEISFSQDMLDIITDMELEAELTQPARIQNAICHLLHQKAFDLARTVPGSEVMKELLSSIEKLTTLDLKRQKLQLERERLLRKPAPADAAHPKSSQAAQYHRVDLNIVPPNRAPVEKPATVHVHSAPCPETCPPAGRQQLPSVQ